VVVVLALALGGACATTEPARAPQERAEPAAGETGDPGEPDDSRRGVKPHYVKCDPEHPEMPCTPDAVPAP
jgi:hypothetical protein